MFESLDAEDILDVFKEELSQYTNSGAALGGQFSRLVANVFELTGPTEHLEQPGLIPDAGRNMERFVELLGRACGKTTREVDHLLWEAQAAARPDSDSGSEGAVGAKKSGSWFTGSKTQEAVSHQGESHEVESKDLANHRKLHPRDSFVLALKKCGESSTQSTAEAAQQTLLKRVSFLLEQKQLQPHQNSRTEGQDNGTQVSLNGVILSDLYLWTLICVHRMRRECMFLHRHRNNELNPLARVPGSEVVRRAEGQDLSNRMDVRNPWHVFCQKSKWIPM